MAIYKRSWILFIGLAVFSQVRGQQEGNPAARVQLQHYLDQNDFFNLRTSYNQAKDHLSVRDQLYFEAFIDNAFNRCETSAATITRLINTYRKDFADSDYINLQMTHIDDCVKTGEYKAAAAIGEELMSSRYDHSLPADQLAGVRSSIRFYRAFTSLPPQKVIRKDSRIDWQRDKVGLMNIPVKVNGRTWSFVFDTGANISTISKSFADSLHLEIIPADFDVASGTSIRVKPSLALAKKIWIGDIEVQNVVFLVLPDEQLSFPQVQYSIHAILGYPVMSQLGEIHILQSGTMYFAEKPQTQELHNVALLGFFPVITLQTGKDTLPYRFDTGAKSTELCKKYFDKYQADVLSQGKEDSSTIGSAGGSVRLKVYRLPQLTLYTNGAAAKLQNIDVLTQKNGEDDVTYGTIGQDFISQFKEMVLSFSPLYIAFK